MADTPEDRAAAVARARPVSAYALVRATVAQDEDAAVLLVAEARRAGELDYMMFSMAQVAARVLLASEGYDVVKVLRTLDQWMQTAATGAPAPPPGTCGGPQHD
jgi:hypothetical protein